MTKPGPAHACDVSANKVPVVDALEKPQVADLIVAYLQQRAVGCNKRSALHQMAVVECTVQCPSVIAPYGLAVFSSSVAHVKRGALFSLYPNNLAVGRQPSGLAALVSAAGFRSGFSVAVSRAQCGLGVLMDLFSFGLSKTHKK